MNFKSGKNGFDLWFGHIAAYHLPISQLLKVLSGLRYDMICNRGLFSKWQKIKLLSLIKSFKLKSGKNFLCQKFTHIWPFQMAQRLSSYLLSGKSRKNVTLLVWFKTLCVREWEPTMAFTMWVNTSCQGQLQHFFKKVEICNVNTTGGGKKIVFGLP